jgi:hypothetical protein
MAIGPIKKGAFHKWLGKKPGEPITDADIAKGIAAGGHPAKMAQFAKAARGFKHGGEKKKPPVKDHAARMYGKDSKSKRTDSSKALPSKRLPK